VSGHDALNKANISERIQWLSAVGPAGIERQRVLFEHAVKETNRVITISQDQPVLRGVPANNAETKPLIERSRFG